jgi:hypothetical protein
MTLFPAGQIANLHRISRPRSFSAFSELPSWSPIRSWPPRKRVLGWVGFIGTLAALAADPSRGPFSWPCLQWSDQLSTFSIFLHIVIIGAAALAILGSLDYLDRRASSAENITRWFSSRPREWAFLPARTNLSPRLSVWR